MDLSATLVHLLGVKQGHPTLEDRQAHRNVLFLEAGAGADVMSQILVLKLVCVRCLDGNVTYIVPNCVCVHRGGDVQVPEVALRGFGTHHLLLASHCHHLRDHEAVLFDVSVAVVLSAGGDDGAQSGNCYR